MSSKQIEAKRIESGFVETTREWVAEEGPLQILVNGIPFTVTLRTPGEDRKLVLGLLCAEGLMESLEDIVSIREELPAGGAQVWSVTLKKPVAEGKLSNRSLASTSSCGLCGKTQWEPQAVKSKSAPYVGDFALTSLPRCFQEMNARQELFGRTGGCHAAAVFSRDGRMLAFGEDVGRHNAVDKTVGEMLEQGNISEAYLLCVSGRVSFEIGSKAARAGISVLAAVSAPSSLAIEYCRDAGITLLGFCRGRRATAYSHGERLIYPPALELKHV